MSSNNRSAPAGAEGSSRLEQRAASAALYHTPPSEPVRQDDNDILQDEDHRLSSAGAATSLKYAKPQDLPSFPVVGVTDKLASAGAAASLANAHRKPVEIWKPDKSASASAAAVLAKDYKMTELWHPGKHPEGSKAAYLAAKEAGHVDVWRPSSTDWGHSAAMQAVRAADTLGPKVQGASTAEARKGSLRASTLAMSGSRKRAGSLPVGSDQHSLAAEAGHKAFDDANMAHDSPMDHLLDDMPPSLRASRITNIGANVPREMFGSHPPVAPEVEERQRAEALHSAAVSMARQMYNLQQKAITNAAGTDRGSIGSTPGARPSTNLEEAARRLAAERLAKLQDEHAAYREYYGTTSAAPPTHRLSLRGRGRRRASSMDQGDEGDEARSRRIRAEMSIFNKNIDAVDEDKRRKDREALMAAAQRNVRASLHNMDERVFEETGKVPPSIMQEWEAKARAKAESDSKARMTNYSRVNIGAGKYVDRSDVEAVAARNVQPVLDEINEKAEEHHAKQEEERRQREQAKWAAEEEKARQRELKAEFKKIYVQDKEESRRKKREEKAKRAEEKRRIKEEKRRAKEAAKAKSGSGTTAVAEHGAHPETEPTRDTSSSSSTSLADTSDDEGEQRELVPQPAVASGERDTSGPVVVETTETVAVITTETIKTKPKKIEMAEEHDRERVASDKSVEPMSPVETAHKDDKAATAPSTSSKGESRVMSWFKDRFSRHGHPSKDHRSDEPHSTHDDHDAQTGTTVVATTTTNATVVSPPHPEQVSSPTGGDMPAKPVISAPVTTADAIEERAVAPEVAPERAHRDDNEDDRQARPRRRSSPPAVSPLSEEESKMQLGEGNKAISPAEEGNVPLSNDNDNHNAALSADGSRIMDNNPGAIGGLAPPPTLAANLSPRTSGSPVRDSKFLENL